MKKLIIPLILFVLISASSIMVESQESVALVRVYADSLGESHFEDISWELLEAEFAPPAPPLLVSEFMRSTAFGIISAAPGWFGEWHPAPERQLTIYLSGRVKATVSDGETRIFGPGDIILLEDTSGTGHRSRVIGEDRAMLAVVRLDE